MLLFIQNCECHCFIAKVHHQNAEDSNAQRVKFQVYFLSQIGGGRPKSSEKQLDEALALSAWECVQHKHINAWYIGNRIIYNL